MTFDRATAIRNSQAEFLALGHPFIDAMLRYIGDYDFGGHTAVRVIKLQGAEKGDGTGRFSVQLHGPPAGGPRRGRRALV